MGHPVLSIVLYIKNLRTRCQTPTLLNCIKEQNCAIEILIYVLWINENIKFIEDIFTQYEYLSETSTKIGGIMYRRTVVSIYSEGGQESTVQEIENRKVNILRSQFSSIINRWSCWDSNLVLSQWNSNDVDTVFHLLKHCVSKTI